MEDKYEEALNRMGDKCYVACKDKDLQAKKDYMTDYLVLQELVDKVDLYETFTIPNLRKALLISVNCNKTKEDEEFLRETLEIMKGEE